MEAMEALKLRRSVREFKDTPIPKNVLESFVEAARLAPTARNVQPWEFVVVTEKPSLIRIGEVAETGRFIAQAAACIAVFCTDTKYYLEDGCAATENILVAAAASGIGSCWVAGDKKPYCQAISKLLAAPESHRLVSLIALGYPKSKDSFKVADKRAVKDLLHWEKF